MVFPGKRSSGCITCRKRKVKVRPTDNDADRRGDIPDNGGTTSATAKNLTASDVSRVVHSVPATQTITHFGNSAQHLTLVKS